MNFLWKLSGDCFGDFLNWTFSPKTSTPIVEAALRSASRHLICFQARGDITTVLVALHTKGLLSFEIDFLGINILISLYIKLCTVSCKVMNELCLNLLPFDVLMVIFFVAFEGLVWFIFETSTGNTYNREQQQVHPANTLVMYL